MTALAGLSRWAILGIVRSEKTGRSSVPSGAGWGDGMAPFWRGRIRQQASAGCRNIAMIMSFSFTLRHDMCAIVLFLMRNDCGFADDE